MKMTKIFGIGAVVLMTLMAFSSVVMAHDDIDPINKFSGFDKQILVEGTVSDGLYRINYVLYGNNMMVLDVWVVGWPFGYHVGTFCFDLSDNTQIGEGVQFLNIVMEHLYPTLDIDDLGIQQ